MPSQMFTLIEWFLTLSTFVQLLSAVNQEVLSQSSSLTVHWAHFCDFSPVWVKMWLFRCWAPLKDFVHSAHLCDFSSLWVKRWLLRCSAWLNVFPHWAHMCTFIALWLSICLARQLPWVNAVGHIVQGCLLTIFEQGSEVASSNSKQSLLQGK